MSKRAIATVSQSYADWVRTPGYVDEQGNRPIRSITENGRARCRCCGERIPSGTPVIITFHQFGKVVAGSHTATRCFYHAASCVAR
jgi:hypothetical protein